MEQIGTHSDDLIFDDSERVEEERIKGVGMEVFDKTGLNCFGVLFIVFIDIGKSLSGCWIDISFDAFVKYRNEFVFG